MWIELKYLLSRVNRMAAAKANGLSLIPESTECRRALTPTSYLSHPNMPKCVRIYVCIYKLHKYNV